MSLPSLYASLGGVPTDLLRSKESACPPSFATSPRQDDGSLYKSLGGVPYALLNLSKQAPASSVKPDAAKPTISYTKQLAPSPSQPSPAQLNTFLQKASQLFPDVPLQNCNPASLAAKLQETLGLVSAAKSPSTSTSVQQQGSTHRLGNKRLLSDISSSQAESYVCESLGSVSAPHIPFGTVPSRFDAPKPQEWSFGSVRRNSPPPVAIADAAFPSPPSSPESCESADEEQNPSFQWGSINGSKALEHLVLLQHWIPQLESLSPVHKMLIWKVCTQVPQFKNYNRSSFRKTIAGWGTKILPNIESITIMYAAIGFLKDNNILKINFLSPTTNKPVFRTFVNATQPTVSIHSANEAKRRRVSVDNFVFLPDSRKGNVSMSSCVPTHAPKHPPPSPCRKMDLVSILNQ